MELSALLQREQGLRYCHEAGRLAKSKPKSTEYLNAYQLCLYHTKNISTLTAAAVEEEEKKEKFNQELVDGKKILKDYYQFSSDDIAKYALGENELPTDPVERKIFNLE
jgi:hypothetical protein